MPAPSQNQLSTSQKSMPDEDERPSKRVATEESRRNVSISNGGSSKRKDERPGKSKLKHGQSSRRDASSQAGRSSPSRTSHRPGDTIANTSFRSIQSAVPSETTDTSRVKGYLKGLPSSPRPPLSEDDESLSDESQTHSLRARNNDVRRRKQKNLSSINPADATLMKQTRTVLLCKMVTGTHRKGVTIDPWLSATEDAFTDLCGLSWSEARNRLTNPDMRRYTSVTPPAEVLELLKDCPVSFRTQMMSKARGLVESLYTFDSAVPSKSMEESARLLDRFAFIAKDTNKPSEAQFLNRSISRLMATTLWGKTQDALGNSEYGAEYFETLSCTTICYFTSLIWWCIREWRTGKARIEMCTTASIQGPYNTLTDQWNAQSDERAMTVACLIKNSIEQYAEPGQTSVALMPIAPNKFKDSLEDLPDLPTAVLRRLEDLRAGKSGSSKSNRAGSVERAGSVVNTVERSESVASSRPRLDDLFVTFELCNGKTRNGGKKWKKQSVLKDITWDEFLEKCGADGTDNLPWDEAKDIIIGDEKAMKTWLDTAAASSSQQTALPRIDVRAWVEDPEEEE